MNVRIVEPPVGGTLDHISSVLPSLIPSAQRVARICLERPAEVAGMSGADLAHAAETSPATVSRTCQALGFQGFQHLRLLLVRDLGAATRDDLHCSEGTEGWLSLMAERSAEMLRTSLASVDPEAFEAAADAIATAGRVLVIGTGASSAPAQAVALKLVLCGRPCEAPADVVVTQLTAAVLGPQDVCLAVSSSGENAVTLAVAAAARRAGARVIGVTGFARSPLADCADILLVAGARFQSWDEGSLGAGLVQLLLLSALQAAVAERMADVAERARQAVREGLLDLVAEGSGSSADEEE